jgi:hypothetical protein
VPTSLVPISHCQYALNGWLPQHLSNIDEYTMY